MLPVEMNTEFLSVGYGSNGNRTISVWCNGRMEHGEEQGGFPGELNT